MVLSADQSEILRQIPRLGLMAGEGRFPILVAQAAAQNSIPVTAFAIEGVTPAELAQYVERIHWLKLGQFSRFIDLLHADGICHVVMAGRVAHNNLWRYRGFDLRTLRVLKTLANRKADSILGAVVEELAREKVTVIDSSLLLTECLPKKGLMTPKRPLTERERKDVEFGFPIARQIAGLDIGQTIVVKDLTVVAVEGLEGTDETIRRAGQIAEGDIVVIKVSKPRQDKRFDMPVIGPQTIRSIRDAGGGALAVMAGEALFFDQAEAIALAQESNIAIEAV
jgi:DUF1009 family protein